MEYVWLCLQGIVIVFWIAACITDGIGGAVSEERQHELELQKLLGVAEYVLHKSVLTAVVAGLIMSIKASPEPSESCFPGSAPKPRLELWVKCAI